MIVQPIAVCRRRSNSFILLDGRLSDWNVLQLNENSELKPGRSTIAYQSEIMWINKRKMHNRSWMNDIFRTQHDSKHHEYDSVKYNIQSIYTYMIMFSFRYCIDNCSFLCDIFISVYINMLWWNLFHNDKSTCYTFFVGSWVLQVQNNCILYFDGNLCDYTKVFNVYHIVLLVHIFWIFSLWSFCIASNAFFARYIYW